LPAFDSEAFARHPGLLDTAFDIPVYLLAMGLFGAHYRPEQLGLNLAIELSGLGAGYLRAIDILRHHGMDPTIIQLHLSIDNLASGHAAWAREAIVLHLDEVRRLGGDTALAAAWRRVWLGYQSLQAASLGLTAGILGRYALHRLGWRVETGPRAPGG
ncbi:MAG: iron-containing redox enzyme family protein, partial [Methylococcus sp.]